MFAIIINAIGFILSIFMGILFLTKYKLNRSSFILNAALLLLFSVFILNSLRILIMGPTHVAYFESLSNSLLLCIGPLLYFMVKFKITKTSFSQNVLPHLIPFAIVMPCVLISKFLQLDKMDMIVQIVGVIYLVLSTAIYCFLSVNLVSQHRDKIEKSTYYAIIGFTIVWHVNLLFNFLEIGTNTVGEDAQIWATLLLSALVILLCYTHWVALINEAFPIKSTLTLQPEKQNQILSKITEELTVNKPYTDKNFSLLKLSQSIGVSSSYISKVVNTKFGMSFPLYISKLRVEEFIRIAPLKSNEHFTIQSMAEESGFKSNSTFVKSFKLHHGELPSSYLKKLRKQ